MRRLHARKRVDSKPKPTTDPPKMDPIKFQSRPSSRSTALFSRNPRQSRPTPYVFAISIVTSLALLGFSYIFLFSSAESTKFGIIIDGGSTGTRIHVFRYRVDRSKTLVFDFKQVSDSLKVNPGLSAYGEQPEAVSDSLGELLEFGRKKVPKEQWGETEIRLMATAGLRLLDVELQDKILEECRKVLRVSGFKFHDEWASVITGSAGGSLRMDSSSPDPPSSLTVDSVADSLKNQSFREQGNDHINNENKNKNIKLRLEDLNWDHSFVRELPGDAQIDSIPREVLHACYTKVLPSAEVENPELVVWSDSVADLLDLDPKEFERPEFPIKISGTSPLAGAVPYAQCYGGHQFGTWAGQLGDGRVITLGEILNSKLERWELQLKGAGKTPYSRFADGLAVLRSSIREFLCSEAMHFLGIPTTRALCLVTTGKLVTRDMFYDGNPKEEPGAIVCRVAQSFLRFGSFQIHASRGEEDLGIVCALADYAIRHHFPHIENISKSQSLSFSTGDDDQSVVDLTSNKYAAWIVEIAERTASLVARWQGVGFTHGVLNTDNMSILGLTIDYGPFGFLDAFDPSYTPNTTDLPGRRYCFANQPDICLWNITQFASSLMAAHLISDKEANYAMERYGTKFMDEYQAIMSQKLGLQKYNKQLLNRLLNNLAVDKVDYTNFFRSLSNIKADPGIPEGQLLVPLKAVLLDIGKERKEAWTSWVQFYIKELVASGISDEERKASMDSVNPKYVLRNYLCQSAIDAAELGDFGEVRRLLKVMERPYDDQPGMEKYARLPPAWAYRPGVCMLSCSS